MKVVAEYLERAHEFERLAAELTDGKFKQELLVQAAAYHKLAENRVKLLNVLPDPPQSN